MLPTSILGDAGRAPGLLLARPRSVLADKVRGPGPGTAVPGQADWERQIRAQEEPRRLVRHHQKSDGVSGLAKKVERGRFPGMAGRPVRKDNGN